VVDNDVEKSFRFWFNRRRNWIDVFLHEVSPKTFHRWGGGFWGYYMPENNRRRWGKFGEIHLVRRRVREDVIAHEIFHLLSDWLRERKVELNEKNEEKIATLLDEMVRSFWREYKKLPRLASKKTGR
jgi:hypothetical protein